MFVLEDIMEVKPPDNMVAEWFRITLEAIPVILVSMFGGLINILNSKKAGFSFGLFFTGLLTAAFVGLIVDSLCAHLGISGSGRFVATSLGGYCSRDLLTLMKSWFMDKAKKIADQDKDDKKDKKGE